MMVRRSLPHVALLCALVLAACQDVTNPAAPEPSASRAEALGTYIVVFSPGTPDVAALATQLTASVGSSPQFVYQAALQGFSATLPESAVAALERHPQVAYVEPDRPREILGQTSPTGIRRIFADANAEIDIDGVDDLRVDVDVAIIDTGVDFQHPDLVVAGGVNCSGGGPFRGSCTAGGDDDHYHGTHVGGTVGALDDGVGVVGVAPGARLWAVKVLNSNGSGFSSWIVAGIDWVAANSATIEVANMSLGGSGFSQAEYDAIQGAVNRGVAFAVAAGNSDANASGFSPGGFNNVLSVSALADFNGAPGGGAAATCRADQDDTLADFSNWGSAVDIAAPGVCILSTFPIEQGEYGTISGTSMASPHVAGALALLASKSNPGSASDVNNLYNAVRNAGNSNWTDDSGDGIKEPLLDVSNASLFNPTMVAGGGGGGGGTTNDPPTAAFTFDCTGLTCSFNAGGSNDLDGTISSYAWIFGDGSTGSGVTPSHTYASGGTFAVSLTVTDDDGATGSSQQDVTVSSGGGGGFTLSASGYKVRGVHHVDFTWSGAATGSVDIYEGSSLIVTTPNDGAHTQNLARKGGGTYTYKVCEAGSTTVCSNSVTITF